MEDQLSDPQKLTISQGNAKKLVDHITVNLGVSDCDRTRAVVGIRSRESWNCLGGSSGEDQSLKV
jgi:hypothetical protein